MNILIATSYPSLPECIGGSQRTADTFARLMIERGHQVSLLCGVQDLESRVMLTDKATRDTSLGYATWRARVATEAIEWVLDKVKADIVIVNCGKQVPMALGARSAGVPVVISLHNVEFWDLGGTLADLEDPSCCANSRFTANLYLQEFGIEPTVIYPLIDQDRYRTETTKENVTFVNPVPKKGLNIVLDVARQCREIPFSIVPSWPLAPSHYSAVEEQVVALPNVQLRPRTMDMREVYRNCRILLAPSIWQETYCCVVSEAQCSGIPVVASNRAGLPESVGEGGILLDPEGPISDWVESVQRLWYDESYYARLSDAAYAHVSRPSLNKEYQLDLWEQVLRCAIKKDRPDC